MLAKGTLAVHSSIAALFASFGYGLLMFFTRGWEKMRRLYCVQTKSFCLGMVEFCTNHHKTHTSRGKKLQVANSNTKNTVRS